MDAKEFAEMIAGTDEESCLVENDHSFWLLRFDQSNTGKKKLIHYDALQPEGQQWTLLPLRFEDEAVLGVAYSPQPEIIAACWDVFYSVRQEKGKWKKKKTTLDRLDSTLRGLITNLRTIDNKLFLCGSWRTVAMRTDGEWQWMTSQIPLTQEELDGSALNMGFTVMDGFAGDDMYAAGDMDDLWHYNGESWRRIALPSNELITGLCCGGDGKVYVAAHSGKVFTGRDDTWKTLETPHRLGHLGGMVWYEDRIWFVDGVNIWQIKDEKIQEAQLPDHIMKTGGNIAVGAGVLLVTNSNCAAYLKDGQWTVLFEYKKLFLEAEEAGLLDAKMIRQFHEEEEIEQAMH